MGGPRKASGKVAPRRNTTKNHNSNGKGKGKGKGKGNDRSTQKQSQRKSEDTHDVFDAESDLEETELLVKRRHLERVDVRDYEVDTIDSDDDEEIDSDDAFDASDEERFDSYKLGSSSSKSASGSKGKSVKFDLEEDEESEASAEEDEDEEDEEDMVDLSEMLDAESSDDEVKKAASGKGKQAATKLSAKELAGRDFNEDFSLGHSDDESEEEDDEVLRAMGSSDSDEEAENGDEQQGTDDEMAGEGSDAKARLSRLDGFVTSISARAPKRRFVSETGGHFAEDENAIGSGLANKGVSLGLNDLLGSLGTEAADDTAEGGEQKATREIRALKDRVQKLERAAKKTGAGVVAAPLAKRLQDQVDRKVAYEKTKKTISEWQPTVNANRAAEHLSFPMNEPEKQVASSASLVSTFHTKTNLESQIQSILAESGMTDEQQQQYEELELKALSPEELRKRRRELRLMRELMFRSEQKAKRMAKIKSKAYRRILKKEKTKAQDKAMERLKEDDPEMYDALMEKMAQNRAEERMTLRHKNTGKWAKDTLKRSHGDVDAQKALREQLDQHDSLKRKIYDLGSDEDVSDYEAGRSQGRDGGNVSDSDEDASFDAIKARTVKRISAEMASGDDDQIAEDTPHKALFGMKFMQNAMQRKREQADRDAQMMRDEFESLEADVDEDGNAISLKKKKADAKAAEPMAAGRMSFGGGLKKRNPDEENRDEGDDGVVRAEDDTPAKRVRLNEAGQIGQVASGGGHKVRLAEPMSIDMPSTISGSGGSKGQAAGKGADNPWLSEEAASHAGHRGGKLSELSKESTKLDKLSAKLRAKRLDRGVGSAGGEEDVLLDVNKTLSLEKPRMGDDSEGGESDSDSDDGIKLEHIDSSKKGKKGKKTPSNPNAFTQRELVEQAFAEDAIVEEEFEAEKEAVMNEEAPKEEDLTLPGWGSWGGTGLSSKKKVIRKAPAGSGVEKSSRLDAKLGSVIINQRQSKSATKYFADNVPFPFYTPEEYEETLQAPLGKEWNTTRSHSKMVKPRVMTKMGRIIDPLVIPSKKKQ